VPYLFSQQQEMDMTFQQFQATRQECGDLAQTIHGAYFEDYAAPASGFLYADGELFIEKFDGEYVLTIGNASGRSGNLEAMERDLYDFAVSEGIV
jgi:hypothetical protein